MANHILNQGQRQSMRLDSMVRVFTRVDRVISGQRVEVKCAPVWSTNAPAWSSGRTITLNEQYLPDVTTTQGIIELTGLNYHELCHVMFTPRQGSRLVKWVIRDNLFRTFNLLEDQRIETLMTGLYRAAAPYFTSTFMRYCMADEEQWKTNHLLAHGRRFLPADVRAEFRKRFEKQHLLTQFDAIIDEYRLLVLPSQDERAFELIQEFERLARKMQDFTGDPNGHEQRPQATQDEGRPLTKPEQESARDWVEWSESEDEEQDDEESDGSGSGKSEDDDESDDESTGSGSGSDDTDDDEDSDGASGDSDSGDSDDEGGSGGKSSGKSDDSNDSGEPGSGAGAGNPDSEGPSADDALRELLGQTQEAVATNSDVQREVKETQKIIVGGKGYTTALPEMSSALAEVSPFAFNASSKFAKELERLRSDLDPGWKHHMSSGRLNVKRAMEGQDVDTLFDSWDSGQQDATDIEAVISVDFSSSMRGQMAEACEAAWVIKRALERVNASVTVLGFADASTTIYSSTEAASPTHYKLIGAQGGTEPDGVIAESAKVLEGSTRKHRLCIYVTDGAWWSMDLAERLNTAMNRAGVTTALAFIGNRYGNQQGAMTPEDRNFCQVYHEVAKPSDLIMFARNIVTNIMKGAN